MWDNTVPWGTYLGTPWYNMLYPCYDCQVEFKGGGEKRKKGHSNITILITQVNISDVLYPSIVF